LAVVEVDAQSQPTRGFPPSSQVVSPWDIYATAEAIL
jgi:hypothetical protein